MTKLIIATKNLGKLQELQLAVGADLELIGISPEIPTPVENGASYLENARIKAKFYSEYLKQPVLADDGGLALAAFPNSLGLQTHGFFKTNSPAEQNQEILALYQNQPQLSREFILQATLVYYGSQEISVQKSLTGLITSPQGKEGYGFDPILWIPERQKTLGELKLAERNQLSPRIRAFKEILPQILTLLEAEI